MALMTPARLAMIREIVSREQVMNAVALNTLGLNILRLVTPVLAGFIIDTYNFEAIYYTMTVLYLIAVGFVTFLPAIRTAANHHRSPLTDIKEGLQYIRHQTALLLIIIFGFVIVVLSMPYTFLMPVFSEDILNVGATGMGILLSVSGVGAVAGSAFLASLPNKKRGVMFLLSGLILGLAIVIFSFSKSWYLSLAMMALVGLGYAGRLTLSGTLLQYYSTDDYRGRVMSISQMELGLRGFGAFFAGLLAGAVGVQWAVGSFAMVLLIIFILALALVPRLRNLD